MGFATTWMLQRLGAAVLNFPSTHPTDVQMPMNISQSVQTLGIPLPACPLICVMGNYCPCVKIQSIAC